MTDYIYPPLNSEPSDLYQQFVDQMQVWLPGWQPQSGNLDDWIALSEAGIISQLYEVASDVATSIFRYFGAFIANLPPADAVSAQGLVNITAVDTVGYTFPAGTDILFVDATGATQGFSTVEAATISPGASAVNGVAVVADIPGAAGNNVTGSFTDLVTPLVWVSNVALQAPTTGGSDAEDDDAYLSRLAGLYTVLTPKPVIAGDFSVLALQQAVVGRATTLDGYDPANQTIVGNLTPGSPVIGGLSSTAVSGVPVGAPVTGANIPAGTFVTATTPVSGQITLSANASAAATGESITVGGSLRNGGEVSVFVTDTNGNALTSSQMGAVRSTLAAQQLQNFVVNVLAPQYTTANVVVAVHALPGQDPATVQSAVQGAIQAYINPATWGTVPTGQPTQGAQAWTTQTLIRTQKLKAAILRATGVDYIDSLTINGSTSDVSLPGVVPLPQLGTLSITVTSE